MRQLLPWTDGNHHHIKSSSHNNNNNHHHHDHQAYPQEQQQQHPNDSLYKLNHYNYETNKPRIYLAIACLWPLLVWAAVSLLHNNKSNSNSYNNNNNNNNTRGDFVINFALGYPNSEPTTTTTTTNMHPLFPPRIGVVITVSTTATKTANATAAADDEDDDLYARVAATVESILLHTPLERILLLSIVVDGPRPYNAATWESSLLVQPALSSKLHVMFNDEKRGIASCRLDGAKLIHLLCQHHEYAGLKSKAEDAILVLMNAGTLLTSHHWATVITQSLITATTTTTAATTTTTTTMEEEPRKAANAVVFPTILLVDDEEDKIEEDEDGPHHHHLQQQQGPQSPKQPNHHYPRMTFGGVNWVPQWEFPSAEELKASKGTSYIAPVWDGAALALRLETWLHLPQLQQQHHNYHDDNDMMIQSAWSANLELSLKLWLCADGMDVVLHLMDDTTTTNTPYNNGPQQDPAVEGAPAALAVTQYKSSQRRPQQQQQSPFLFEWEPTMSARLAHLWMDPAGKMLKPRTKTLQQCRSMKWYTRHVNPHLAVVVPPPPLWEEKERKEHDRSDPIQNNNNNQEQKPKQQNQLQQQPRKERDILTIPRTNKEASNEGIVPVQNGGDSNSSIGAGAGENQPLVVVQQQQQQRKKPSKPLCDECLKIVKRAIPVNLDYVNVSGGHLEHPHKGARDANGTEGYIHNETRLRRNPPPPLLGIDPETLGRICQIRDDTYRMLTEQVFVHVQGHADETEAAAIMNSSKVQGEDRRRRSRVTLFCLVYTTQQGHDKIRRIQETWGPKCDAFLVGSTQTDPSLDTVEILHEGPEEYDNIWQKVRSMWAYIYDNYYETNDYDWFHIVGDDAFVLVENLRLYLESEEIRTAANGGVYLPDGTETYQTPLFLGRRFALNGNRNFMFNSGGSGYTINKAALKVLVVQGAKFRRAHDKTFSEDTAIAALFRTLGNIYPYDTKDEHGGERYMPFMPGDHYSYRLPTSNFSLAHDWYAKYSIDIKTGREHCAAKSIAFHYVKGLDMYRLYALLYGKCPNGTLS